MNKRWAVLLLAFTALFGALVAIGGGGSERRSGGGPPRWTVRVALPLGLAMDLRVTRLLRLATSPLGRRLLDGRRIASPYGELLVTRQDDALHIRCLHCRVLLPEVASPPLHLAQANLVVRRSDDRLAGSLRIDALQVDYEGELEEEAVALRWRLAPARFAEVLVPLRSAIPELARVRLEGRLGAQGTLLLPSRQVSVAPEVDGLEVFGLGTEHLRFGAFSYLCRDTQGRMQRRPGGEGSSGWIPLAGMGRWLPRAVIAAEDIRFYRHPGFDLVELRRSQEGGPPRGASTLSQQLAKNFFTGADPTFARKLRELLYAVEMERTLGKQRILALYLNTVEWGPGICGADAAARHYFGVGVADLLPAQAAWLAGILRNPRRAHDTEFVEGHLDERRLRWVMANMRLPARIRRQIPATPVTFSPGAVLPTP